MHKPFCDYYVQDWCLLVHLEEPYHDVVIKSSYILKVVDLEWCYTHPR